MLDSDGCRGAGWLGRDRHVVSDSFRWWCIDQECSPCAGQ